MLITTNRAGHFLFTELLLSALEAGAKSSPDGFSRVVTTSSSGAYGSGLDYEALKDTSKRKAVGSRRLYFQSKLVCYPVISFLVCHD